MNTSTLQALASLLESAIRAGSWTLVIALCREIEQRAAATARLETLQPVCRAEPPPDPASHDSPESILERLAAQDAAYVQAEALRPPMHDGCRFPNGRWT